MLLNSSLYLVPGQVCPTKGVRPKYASEKYGMSRSGRPIKARPTHNPLSRGYLRGHNAVSRTTRSTGEDSSVRNHPK